MMRFDRLLDQLADECTRDLRFLRRVAYLYLPIVLLPSGLALVQIPLSWLGLIVGGLIVVVLVVQFSLALQPVRRRAEMNWRDLSAYIQVEADQELSLAPVVQMLIPAAVALSLSVWLAMRALPPETETWRLLTMLGLVLAVIWGLWDELVRVYRAIAHFAALIQQGRHEPAPVPTPLVRLTGRKPVALLPATAEPRQQAAAYGLLDPMIADRVAQLPWPALRLSPAAQALLRLEAYLMLRDMPGRSDADLIAALHGLGQELLDSERRHIRLPAVGGKIYLPIAANGPLALNLRTSVQRLKLDGAYSATLGTWLVRLPPAQSYLVAGRLIDSLLALRLLPPGRMLPHHLTVQGDLGQQSRSLSILHLVSLPLILELRQGHAQRDERPFIMRGGGVLDDLDGRGRGSGLRTDFVDGFLLAGMAEMRQVEHLSAHTMNLRLKQVMAFGITSTQIPEAKRSYAEQQAAAAYWRAVGELHVLLKDYQLETALEVDWLDHSWSEVWRWLERVNLLKQQDPAFLDRAEALRTKVLDDLEHVAVTARATL